MNQLTRYKNISAITLISLFILSCANEPKVPTGYSEVHQKLMRLQADPNLATQAPIATKDAEEAVLKASRYRSDEAYSKHLVWVADHKVDIAYAEAQGHFYEEQRKDITKARETARLDARTQEADLAHRDAQQSKLNADMAMRDAEKSKLSAEQAQSDAQRAKDDADIARQQAEELQQQIIALNAKATERGLVVTLGDLLFENDKSDLRAGAANNLAKLSAFLIKYPLKGVLIEGHTDSVGADSYNQDLSERRANSVRNYLLSQGIDSSRIQSSGKGETTPIASNDNSSGRQMNRRVEVIITSSHVTMN